MAISVEISGVKVGAFVGASFFNSPGRKKLAGETLWLAFTPPQPAAASDNAANRARHEKFQFNLTCGL